MWNNRWARSTIIAVTAGAFLAVAGAFDTGSVPLGFRLASWMGLMAVGTPVALLIRDTLARIPLMARRPVIGVAAFVLANSVFVSIMIWAWLSMIFGLLAPPHTHIQAPSPLTLFPYVVLVSLVMTAIHMLLAKRSPMTHASPVGAPPSKFLARLPVKLRGSEIYAVESEDHYLRLHTSKGSDLILMRLSDAVAELEGLEGAQVHRSWWVAKAAVADVRRSDGRAVLKLVNGVEAPVSRSYLKALRQAGWF